MAMIQECNIVTFYELLEMFKIQLANSFCNSHNVKMS